MNRLTRRRKLVIAGCVFAAVLAGVACTGYARAATMDVTVLAIADHLLAGSSDWTWSASSGDQNSIPPLAPGQEVVTGGYHETLLATGLTSYGAARSLNTSDTIRFRTDTAYRSSGPGSYEESLAIVSAGSAAAGVSCDSAGLEDENPGNYTAAPYYERTIASTVFLAENLTYRSHGRIEQADLETPDRMDYAMTGSGSGIGMFRVDSVSMGGIGPVADLGSMDGMQEWITAGGKFGIGAVVEWTSFSPVV